METLSQNTAPITDQIKAYVAQDEHAGRPDEEWDTLYKFVDKFPGPCVANLWSMDWREWQECGFEADDGYHTTLYRMANGQTRTHHDFEPPPYLAFPLEYGRSNISINDDWISASGYMEVRDTKWYETLDESARREVAEGELKEMRNWMEGEVYMVQVQKERPGVPDEIIEGWITGFYGMDAVRDHITEVLGEGVDYEIVWDY